LAEIPENNQDNFTNLSPAEQRDFLVEAYRESSVANRAAHDRDPGNLRPMLEMSFYTGCAKY
jgi:hypothetical protein